MFLFTRLTPGLRERCPSRSLSRGRDGCIFAPAFSTATLGVEGSEAGVASAMSTPPSRSAPVGTSLLSTIFSAVASYTVSPPHPGLADAAAVHNRGLLVVGRIFALGFLLALVILPGRPGSPCPPSGLRSPVTRSATATTPRLRMAPLPGLALRQALRGDEHRPLACAASAWETLPRRALRMAPRPRWPQTTNPASSPRRSHRSSWPPIRGPRDSCGRVMAAPAHPQRPSAICRAAATSPSSISSFGTATTNEPDRANRTAAGIHTTNTTASAGLISSTAAASAVFEPSDPSWQNNTGLFTGQPPVARITQSRVKVLRGILLLWTRTTNPSLRR